jgi:hypothetical protein
MNYPGWMNSGWDGWNNGNNGDAWQSHVKEGCHGWHVFSHATRV